MSKTKLICNFSKSSLVSIIFAVFVTSLIFVGTSTFTVFAEDESVLSSDPSNLDLEKDLSFEITPLTNPPPVNCNVDENVVGLVTTNGWDTTQFSTLVGDLEGQGYTVRELDVSGGIPACVNQLIISSAFPGCLSTQFTVNEENTIVDWITEGGGIWINGEWGPNCGSGTESLIENFVNEANIDQAQGPYTDGVHFDSSIPETSTLFEGVNSFSFGTGSHFTEPTTVDVVVRELNDQPVMVAGNFGNGCVVILGDSNWPSNSYIDTLDRRQLANNIIPFLDECSGMPPGIWGFTDYFAPENWTFFSGGDGFWVTEDAPEAIELWGSDNACNDSRTFVEIEIPSDGTIAFDWEHTTFDVDGAGLDPGGYILNGEFIQITNDNVPEFGVQTGTEQVQVSEGDMFGFGIEATDCVLGPGAFTMIYNFHFDGEVPDADPVTDITCDLPELSPETEVIVDGENITFMLAGTCDVTRNGITEEGLEVKVTVDKDVPGLTIPDESEVLLNEWRPESFGGASWNVANDKLSVLQTVNGNPTFFYAPFNAINSQFTGKISVANDGDDDFIGFVLGFQPGDTTNPNAEYLLVDWKKGNQNAFGAFAPAGLAVSKISGIPNDTEFWGHQGKVTELARGINLGSTGWQYNTDYEFSFVFTENNLKVFVNGVLELDINGNFTDGRYGFYNFSQSLVTYSGFAVAPVFDETGTVTIDFLDESGSITIDEEGKISVSAQGPTYSISGLSTGASGSGDYSILPQCGAQSFVAIDNNDSASGEVSLNQCPVPEPETKKKSGGDNNWDTRPTFGISHEDRNTQIVENGFRFNSEEFMLTDNHHTDFAEQAVEVGTTNSFSATVFAIKGLKVQEFLFGIPNVGESHLAELGVEVWYDFDGNIEDVIVVQKSEVIDADTISVSHEKTKCLSTDADALCDTTTVAMKFNEPLKDKVMAVKAIDFKNRDQRTYLNDGFDVFGDSLNPMISQMIPSNVRDQGLLKVTQESKYSPYWTSEDGRTFEMNSFGSFKEINQTFERFADTGNAYTRMHSGFGGILQYEQNRASDVFDASQYTAQLPESFAYIYPETGERLSEELIQEMLLQQEIAKGILEQMDKQTRHH